MRTSNHIVIHRDSKTKHDMVIGFTTADWSHLLVIRKVYRLDSIVWC